MKTIATVAAGLLIAGMAIEPTAFAAKKSNKRNVKKEAFMVVG